MNKIFNCIDCNEEFEMSASEVEWYETKGLQLPKRDKFCRAKKKLRNGLNNNLVNRFGTKEVKEPYEVFR